MPSERTPPDADDDPTGDPADVFGALSDPLRVEILRSLSEHHRETHHENPIGFADLRRRVGVDDSGRFRYHLQRLRGKFVEKADEGYRLAYVGRKTVAAILTGTYTTDLSKDATELDSECFVCDDPAVATYESGNCTVACTNDHLLFGWQVPPSAATDATLPEIVELAELLARQGMERALGGHCPECYHPVEAEVLIERTERPVFRAECETCGGRLISPAGYCLLADSRVAALYRRHGRDLDEHHIWDLPFVRDGDLYTVVEDRPVRIEVTVSVEDETVVATIDEAGHVVDHRLTRE